MEDGQLAREGICWEVAERLVDGGEGLGGWRLWGSCWEGEGRSLRRV